LREFIQGSLGERGYRVIERSAQGTSDPPRHRYRYELRWQGTVRDPDLTTLLDQLNARPGIIDSRWEAGA